MHPDGTILVGAVVRTLAKDGLADLMLGELLGMIAQRALRKVAKEVAEAVRFLEGTAGDYALDELPARVACQLGFQLNLHYRHVACSHYLCVEYTIHRDAVGLGRLLRILQTARAKAITR